MPRCGYRGDLPANNKHLLKELEQTREVLERKAGAKSVGLGHGNP